MSLGKHFDTWNLRSRSQHFFLFDLKFTVETQNGEILEDWLDQILCEFCLDNYVRVFIHIRLCFFGRNCGVFLINARAISFDL